MRANVLPISLGTLLSAGVLPAQAEQPSLPDAATILDRHVEATGGKQAHLAHSTRKLTGTMAVDIAGHQFEVKVEAHEQAPANRHLLLQRPGFYRVRACNGEAAWEWQPPPRDGDAADHRSDGSKLLTGLERVRSIAAAQFYLQVKWREHFPRVETKGLADVAGSPAYEVAVTTKRGETYSRFYDRATGRLVKFARPTKSGHLGELDIEVSLTDYREFDGVWLPMKVTELLKSESFGEGTQTWTYATVEHGVEIDPSLFELPAELKKQRAKQAKTGGHE